jgi:hypothetical protein
MFAAKGCRRVLLFVYVKKISVPPAGRKKTKHTGKKKKNIKCRRAYLFSCNKITSRNAKVTKSFSSVVCLPRKNTSSKSLGNPHGTRQPDLPTQKLHGITPHHHPRNETRVIKIEKHIIAYMQKKISSELPYNTKKDVTKNRD